MTIPARTIRELGELIGASRATDIAAVLNMHKSKLPPLTGMTRHVYTTDDCYPAAVGRLQAMAAELLIEREELLEKITRYEDILTPDQKIELARRELADARAAAADADDADWALLREFDVAVAADYPERTRG